MHTHIKVGLGSIAHLDIRFGSLDGRRSAEGGIGAGGLGRCLLRTHSASSGHSVSRAVNGGYARLGTVGGRDVACGRRESAGLPLLRLAKQKGHDGSMCFGDRMQRTAAEKGHASSRRMEGGKREGGMLATDRRRNVRPGAARRCWLMKGNGPPAVIDACRESVGEKVAREGGTLVCACEERLEVGFCCPFQNP